MGANVSQQVVQRGTAQYFSLADQDKHQMSSRLPASNLPKVGKSAVPMALPYSSTGPDPLNYHAKDSVSAKQKAGVGILFSENTDPYTGRSQVVVKKIFPGGPAEATGLVKEGDMLTDVNGEDVVGKTLNELAETIPGPPETPISMGFMSKDTQQFYEVDMLRSMSGGPQVGQIKAVQPPGPVAPPDAPGSMNNRSVGPMAASVGPQSPPPQHEPVKQPPPLGEATVGFSFQRDESGSVKVANITFGSNAQQLGFEGDEILERIDNKSIEAWEDESIKYALSGPFSTLVQVKLPLPLSASLSLSSPASSSSPSPRAFPPPVPPPDIVPCRDIFPPVHPSIHPSIHPFIHPSIPLIIIFFFSLPNPPCARKSLRQSHVHICTPDGLESLTTLHLSLPAVPRYDMPMPAPNCQDAPLTRTLLHPQPEILTVKTRL
jgi:hypothetical protein